MSVPTTPNTIARRGALVAASGSVCALLLIPARNVTPVVAVFPRMWDVLLRPTTAVALATLFCLIALVSTVWASVRDEVSTPSATAVLSVAVLASLLVLSAYHNAAGETLAQLQDSESTNEPVMVRSELTGLPTPYTISGRESFWSAVRRVQEVRVSQLGYPTSKDEPFSTMYAELAQSRLGAGDVSGAKTASAQLVTLAPHSPLAWLVAAKVAYASGDTAGALDSIGRSREQLDVAADPGSELVARWLDGMEAYYRAADFAARGAHEDAAASLTTYARLSFDPFILDRVGSDKSFDEFSRSTFYQDLGRAIRDIPAVDRNSPGASG